MEKRGVFTTSARPPTYLGTPTRTGMWNTSSASSTMPGIRLAPPVSTMPEDSKSSKPLRRSSCCTSWNSSSTRGSTTSASVARDI